MNPFRRFRDVFQQARSTALRSGSPLRLTRKMYLQVRDGGEHAARRAQASKLAHELNAAEGAHVEMLTRIGCSRLSDELPAEILQRVTSAARERLRAAAINEEGGSKKSFWLRLREPDDLCTSGALVQLALTPTVLRTVSSAFGEVPYLADIELIVSFGTKNTSWQESQLWHRDYADTKTIKLFIYLSDVHDEADGPFTFYPIPQSKRIKNRLVPERIADDAMNAQCAGSSPTSMLGPAGTAFYIDTANCYHRGSRAQLGHQRIAYVATFITHASMDRYENQIRIDGTVDDLARRVLTTRSQRGILS